MHYINNENTKLHYFSVVYWACFPVSSSAKDYTGNNHEGTKGFIWLLGVLHDFLPFVVIEVIGVNPCAMAGKEDP